MFRKIFILFIIPGILFAKERYIPDVETGETAPNQPWFTGPLIASGSTTIPVGHWNIQPYFFATQVPAEYSQDWDIEKVPTFWTLNTIVPLWVGLTTWMDIQVQPQWSWNHQAGVGGHWVLGDTNVQLEFQLYRADFPPKNWLPSIKIAIRETMPTGRYRHLSASKHSVEDGGSGSWATSFIFVIGRMFHLSGLHYLSTRLNGMYTVFAPVHVKGFNNYGGGYGTDGSVRPRPSFFLDFGLELSLTRNWAFALDVIGRWRGGNSFSGTPGRLPGGMPASNTSLAGIQYSIAPAIEYNFNAQLGIIAGPWITFAGKESNQFYSGVISVNYYQ